MCIIHKRTLLKIKSFVVEEIQNKSEKMLSSHTNFTFDDLLRVYFALYADRSQLQIASDIGVSPQTLNNWLNGKSKPQSKTEVIGVCRVLGISALEADLLLYAAHPSWSNSGTPIEVLKNTTLLRYMEYDTYTPAINATTLSPQQIEMWWKLIHTDTFATNSGRWGLGVKTLDNWSVKRDLVNNTLQIGVTNWHHESMMVSGDSSIFAPKQFYFCFETEKIDGSDEDGPLLIFDEICDLYMGFVRLRLKDQQVSVAKTKLGSAGFDVFVNRHNCDYIKSIKNKLGLLCFNSDFYIYINDHYITNFYCKQLDISRIDVGVIHGVGSHTAKFSFSNLRLYVPNRLHKLVGTVTQW